MKKGNNTLRHSRSPPVAKALHRRKRQHEGCTLPAWQRHISSRSISLSISAGSPGNSSSRKPSPRLPKSTQTTSLAFSWPWLELWEFPSGGRGGDPRAAACSWEGALLVETGMAVTFRLLAGDSPVPHVPPLMWVWRDPYASSSGVSAPSEHGAPPAFDMGAMSPSKSIATSCRAVSRN